MENRKIISSIIAECYGNMKNVVQSGCDSPHYIVKSDGDSQNFGNKQRW